MTDRNEMGTGWRESVWNRPPAAVYRRHRLTLPSRGRPVRVEPGPGSAAEEGSSLLQFLTAPWMRPVRQRYETGNRWLMRLLEWVTKKTWPLAMLDDMCTWFEEGSAASRMFAGTAAAAVMAALLTLWWGHVTWLQSMALRPVFDGHGTLVAVAASFLVGATVLPLVLGHVLGVVLRFYVLVNLCTMAALVGYGSWLLYSYVKF